MAGENEDWNWPISGQDGPDVEWEHVPIPPPSPISSNIFIPPISSKETEDNKGEEGQKEQKLPSVEGIQLGGEEEEKGALPKVKSPKVRTFERYIPSPEEIKALPDNMDEIFDKHGDDIILEDDEDGKNQHIYFLFGQHEGKKHYKCIKKDCGSSLLVEEIFQPSPPPSPSRSPPRNPPPTQKEDELQQEDHKEGAKKKKRKSKKKSKKTAKEGNPQEGNLPQEEENEDWNK